MSEREALDSLVKWLDESNLVTREEIGLRVLKVCEESGEAAKAWIGFTGQNPRKGITHTKDEVIAELLDTALTALLAAQSVKGDSVWYQFAGHMHSVVRRNRGL